MKEKILTLLQQELPDIDFNTKAKLVTDEILDSLKISQIIAAFTIELGITIPYEEIIEDNFDSVDAMAAMVNRLLKNA